MNRKPLPRRTVLKGIGTSLALPFLEAALPPLRASVKPTPRFLTFYVPNGMAMEYWTPAGEGSAMGGSFSPGRWSHAPSLIGAVDS